MHALAVHVKVRGDVFGERVDGAAVVDDDEEQRQVLLGRGVERLGHAPVLRAALADEDDRDPIVPLVFRRVAVAVEENRARCARGIGQLLRHERPAALEERVLVVDVHRAARAFARAADLAEELGHDSIGRDAARERVRVLAVVAVLDVGRPNGVPDERRDAFLPVVEVHEPPDVPLHVRLIARVLELPREQHHLVRGDEVARAHLLVPIDVRTRHPEVALELRAAIAPRDVGPRPHGHELGLRFEASRAPSDREPSSAGRGPRREQRHRRREREEAELHFSRESPSCVSVDEVTATSDPPAYPTGVLTLRPYPSRGSCHRRGLPGLGA